MSSIFRAEGLDTLMGYIMGYSGSCCDYGAETIKALGVFLRSRGRVGIPWFRMYDDSPECQHQMQALDKDVVLQGGAMVVYFTLVKPRHRKASGGGTWISKGRRTINNQFIITKLYYDDGPNMALGQGFTVVEFALERGHQIAICVLHRKGYVHLVRDLRWGHNHGQGADEGNYSGANQANNAAVQHQPAPIISAPPGDVGGSMNGSQVLHSTTQFSNSEANGSCEQSAPAPSFSFPNEDIWMDNIPYFGLYD